MEELKCLDKIWHKQCFKCTSCGMTLNMKNYKGYEKQPYCEPHYPKTTATAVTDTPEMRRLAENTKIQSQVQYHAEYEKMKGTKTQIADDPEIQRHKQNTQIQSQVQYHGEVEKKKKQEQARPDRQELGNSTPSVSSIASSANTSALASPTSPMPTLHFNGDDEQELTPYSKRLAAQSGTIIYSTEQGGKVPVSQRQVGSIADYDPLNGNWGTVGSGRSAEKIGNSIASSNAKQASHQFNPVPQTNGGSPARIGSAQNSNRTTGFVVKALYDYEAKDTDEVSFQEGDVIVNCQMVDEGWMTGTVQRTLFWGMLPANYVERINIPTGLSRLS